MQKLKTPDNLRPARYPLGTSDQYLKIAACNFAFTLNMNVSIKPQGKLKSIVVKLYSQSSIQMAQSLRYILKVPKVLDTLVLNLAMLVVCN